MSESKFSASVRVICNTDGDVIDASLASWSHKYRQQNEIQNLDVNNLPLFLRERIALVKLQGDKEKSELGRRFITNAYTIFVNDDEFMELTEIPSA
jgi:hypothetical protein